MISIQKHLWKKNFLTLLDPRSKNVRKTPIFETKSGLLNSQGHWLSWNDMHKFSTIITCRTKKNLKESVEPIKSYSGSKNAHFCLKNHTFLAIFRKTGSEKFPSHVFYVFGTISYNLGSNLDFPEKKSRFAPLWIVYEVEWIQVDFFIQNLSRFQALGMEEFWQIFFADFQWIWKI